MNAVSRRTFLHAAAVSATIAPAIVRSSLGATPTPVEVSERIRGLILGSALGDALGGPIEFQARDAIQRLADPPKLWRDEEVLDAPARRATAGRLRLRSYTDLRPQPESYGQWNVNSVPGTITDDTRHKLVLLLGLREAERTARWPFTVAQLAQTYLDWPKTDAVVGRTGYEALAADWLEEWQFGARWVLGERDLAKALPPERMWQGLPTCCGQMTLLPVAAIYAGEPERAYRAAYDLAFFDNGFGKDMNAALVAGLAVALVTPVEAAAPAKAWEMILSAVRETDPFRHGKIRWSERAVHRWLDLALKFVREADGRPARLFAALEKEFAQTTKWEAQVPFVVTFACLAIAEYDPLAALQLSMEWGHDSDSYAQLTGAFIGALHGPRLFPADWREAVTRRLQADHGVDLEAESRRLTRLRERAARGERVIGN